MRSKSFTFHEEWIGTLSGLPSQVRLEVYDAIVEYGISGTHTSLKAMAELVFNIIRNSIDNDNHRAESIKRKRSEAGKKHKGNQYSSKNGTDGTSVPTEWDKCSKPPVNKGVSEDSKNGTSVPNLFDEDEKVSFPPVPPNLQKEEDNPYSARIREEVSFEDFWKAYGYKKAKKKAESAWKRLSVKDKKAALDAITAYKRDCDVNGRSQQYPATYLNGRTWEDEFRTEQYAASKLNYRPSHEDNVREVQQRLLANIPRPNVAANEERRPGFP